MNILDTMNDPALFGPWFQGTSWDAWRVFLAVLFGLPMPTVASFEVFTRCTARSLYVVGHTIREAWLVIGRRGGKSLIIALVAVFAGCFRDYSPFLAPGEVATIALFACDRRQARILKRYIHGLLHSVPMLAAMIVNETTEAFELSNRVVIEIHTTSSKTGRGYTFAVVICDEVGFWWSDDSANPDTEILNALRPGMATIPGALLLAMSSPYARRGALWEAYRKHYGRDGDPVLVWQAPTLAMNPTVSQQVIADAYADDEAVAAAEYGAEFRRDLEVFISRDAVDTVVVPFRRELPPVSDCSYTGFVDPSGGSQDAMTLAIAHQANDLVVLDAVRERRPPFSPAAVVEEFAALLKLYGIGTVTGDRYAGEWVREPFREQGLAYHVSEHPRSDLYRDLLPLVNSHRVELLDHPRLIAQLCGLERRTGRSGKDSIDHAPGAHDDIANAVAGALGRAHTDTSPDLTNWDGVIAKESYWRRGF